MATIRQLIAPWSVYLKALNRLNHEIAQRHMEKIENNYSSGLVIYVMLLLTCYSIITHELLDFIKRVSQENEILQGQVPSWYSCQEYTINYLKKKNLVEYIKYVTKKWYK